MRLSEVLEALASSELANLSYVEDGQIVAGKLNQVISAINLGLINLYTRFKLKKGFLLLDVSTSHNTYSLTKENAISNNPDGYILDNDKPYEGDLIEILEITNPLNMVMQFDGSEEITLLKPDTLKFRYVNQIGTYIIEYAALPTKLSMDGEDIYSVEVELPDIYLNALLFFVASRLYSPVGVSMDNNRNSMDVSYIQRYETECKALMEQGVDVDTNHHSSVFFQRGFV